MSGPIMENSKCGFSYIELVELGISVGLARLAVR